MYIAWVELSMKPLGSHLGSTNLVHRLELEEKKTVLFEVKNATRDEDAVIKSHQEAEQMRLSGGWGESRVVRVVAVEARREIHILDE